MIALTKFMGSSEECVRWYFAPEQRSRLQAVMK